MAPQPGLLFVRSKITKPDVVSDELFTKWYEEVHIPDIFKTSGFKSAFRWKSINPKDDRPYLAIYPLEDVNFLQTDEFKAIPVHSDLFPAPHGCFDFADFDTRYYVQTQAFEGPNSKNHPGPGNLLMAAALEPPAGQEKDFDDWYREEHLGFVYKSTGYVRTRRYELQFARQNRLPSEEKEIPEPPKFLALHEFDGEQLPMAELVPSLETEWSKRIMKSFVKNDTGVFKLLKAFGDVDVKV